MKRCLAMGLLWLSIAVSLCAAVSAEQVPVKADARASLGREGPYWVGQSVPLNLDLRSTAFAFGGQQFDAPKVDGALVLNPESGASKFSEQQDGETWQVQRYQYRLFPQRSGSLSVPAFEVAFSVSAGYGRPETDFRFTTGPLSFEVSLPPGARTDVPLVSTSRFVVEQTWDPSPGSLKIGDALTRRVVLRALDLPGMALPMLDVPRIAGIAVYPRQPDVQDNTDRGSLEGERVESQTFVMQRAGSYEIPGGVVQWWNPQAETLAEVAVEPLKIEVAANPALAVARALDASLQRPSLLVTALAAAVLGLVLLVWAYRAVRRRRLARQAQRAQSEQGYFERFQQACRGEDASSIYNALTQWQSRWGGDRRPALALQGIARLSRDPALADHLEGLQYAVANREPYAQGPVLDRLLGDVRKQLQSSGDLYEGSLRELNPRGDKAFGS
jgi:hypothetical protein